MLLINCRYLFKAHSASSGLPFNRQRKKIIWCAGTLRVNFFPDHTKFNLKFKKSCCFRISQNISLCSSHLDDNLQLHFWHLDFSKISWKIALFGHECAVETCRYLSFPSCVVKLLIDKLICIGDDFSEADVLHRAGSCDAEVVRGIHTPWSFQTIQLFFFLPPSPNCTINCTEVILGKMLHYRDIIQHVNWSSLLWAGIVLST